VWSHISMTMYVKASSEKLSMRCTTKLLPVSVTFRKISTSLAAISAVVCDPLLPDPTTLAAHLRASPCACVTA